MITDCHRSPWHADADDLLVVTSVHLSLSLSSTGSVVGVLWLVQPRKSEASVRQTRELYAPADRVSSQNQIAAGRKKMVMLV